MFVNWGKTSAADDTARPHRKPRHVSQRFVGIPLFSPLCSDRRHSPRSFPQRIPESPQESLANMLGISLSLLERGGEVSRPFYQRLNVFQSFNR